MLPRLSIGPVRVDPGLVLSPMSGITDSPFRRAVKACSDGAVGLLVTEFISVEGLTRNNMRSHEMLAYEESERPISVQIFGSDIDRMVAAAEIAQERGADIVDINAGCPVPKVVKRGGGAELMRRCDRLDAILRAVVRAVDVPVTLKTRSGWNSEAVNAVEVAQVAEAAGCRMVAVHGRTRAAAYTGEADWDVIDAVAGAVGIPVLGSGDVRTPEDAEHRLRTSRVAGLMIGRHAMRNPWIFRAIRDHLEGRPSFEPTVDEQVDFLRGYALALAGHFRSKAVPGKVKRIASQFTKGLPGGAQLRSAIYACHAVDAVLDVLARYAEAAEAPETEVEAA